jgi:2-aminoethylphosphonate-pyruvate transaminase
VQQYWLFNPGPVNTSDTVKRAAIAVDLCHREPEFSDLMQRVRQGLVEAAGVKTSDYTPVLVSGSGTAAVELAVGSVARPGKSMLVIRNGVYGERIDQMAGAYGIDRRCVDAPWTVRPPLEPIEKLLQSDPSIDAVALVHHETTTGLINPVRDIGRLCHEHDKLFILDSVSGFAGEELDLAACHVDLMACTANKCLHGLPGIAFLLVSARARAHLEQVKARSVYFDLRNSLMHQERGDVPFTPCVPAVLGLEQALSELASEGGVDARIALYKKRSEYLRRELRSLGVQLFLSPELLSNSLTTFRLPSGMTYGQLHDDLKARGFVIYAGQGKIASEIFRVANLGHVPMHIYEELVAAISEALTSHARAD